MLKGETTGGATLLPAGIFESSSIIDYSFPDRAILFPCIIEVGLRQITRHIQGEVAPTVSVFDRFRIREFGRVRLETLVVIAPVLRLGFMVGEFMNDRLRAKPQFPTVAGQSGEGSFQVKNRKTAAF